MKKLIIIILAIAFIAAGVGYYIFNKPLESTQSMKADFTMQADELLTAFEEDEAIANSLYLDKVIEVKGTVQKLETKDGKTTIYIDSSNPLSSLIFQLEEPILKVETGDLITLKGICTGYLMDVVLVRAVII